MSRAPATVVAVALALAACSSSGSHAATKASTTAVPAASTTTRVVPSVTAPPGDAGAIFAAGYPKVAGGECDGMVPGKAHVLMTFCHGPATLEVTIGGSAHTLAGVCWTNGGSFELDAGVAPGPGWTGPWPDYATMRPTSNPGPYRDELALLVFGGTRTFVTNAHGTLAGGFTGGTIEGKDSATQAIVTGTFTCQ